MSKRNKILIGVAAALALLLIFFIVTRDGEDNSDDTTKVTASPKVKGQSVQAYGIIKANNTKNIIIDFPAVIKDVRVKNGQKVKNGEVLFTLNMDEYLLQIRAKEQELREAQNEASRLGGELSKNETDPGVGKLKNDLRNAEDQYEKSLKEYKDKAELFNLEAISQRELDDAEKNVQSKRKDIQDIQYSIDSSKYNKTTDLSQKSMAVDKLQTEISTMREKLNRSYIKGNSIVADMDDCIVSDIGYSTGDVADASKKALSIMQVSSMVVEANVNEAFIKDVSIGESVIISPQADKSKKYDGTVITISNKAVQEKGDTYIPVQISIDNRDEFLLPNYNVDVQISATK